MKTLNQLLEEHSVTFEDCFSALCTALGVDPARPETVVEEIKAGNSPLLKLANILISMKAIFEEQERRGWQLFYDQQQFINYIIKQSLENNEGFEFSDNVSASDNYIKYVEFVRSKLVYKGQ